MDKRSLIASALLCGLSAQPASAECRMSPSFMQPNVKERSGSTSVWAADDRSALLFKASLNVNTDGTRRSYSVADFWGETVALNNVCNAMSDACAGLTTEQLRQRRIDTQTAHAQGWPADALKAVRLSPQILPFRNGKPCPLIDGFLVSSTALHRPNVADVCDASNYVDALTVPAIVLPKRPPSGGQSGFQSAGASVGDLAVVAAPGAAEPVYAVVGDTGPWNKLGEGSVALNGRLLNKTAPPQNYLEIRGRGAFKGKGWDVPEATVLVFAKTRNREEPYMTAQRIDRDARALFEGWGGMARLRECDREYGP